MKKKLLVTAIAGAMAAPMAAQAIEYSISGHVNRMIRFADDGKASEIQQLDNSASQTRIRWQGNGDMGRGMKAGIYIETGVSSANSSAATIKLNGDSAQGPPPGNPNASTNIDTDFNIRHSRLSFSGRWGMVQLGHTSPSGDGMTDQNQSGATIASGGFNAGNDFLGGIFYRTGGGGTSVLRQGNSYGRQDPGRRDVLRYDSPALGPVTVTGSVSNDSAWDIAAYGNAPLGGGNLRFSGGYASDSNRSNKNVWGLSASYLFSQGTNIQGQYSDVNWRGGMKDGWSWAFEVGHKWGNNAVAINYGQSSNIFANPVGGVSINGLGVGFVHTIPKPGIELYAGFSWSDPDLGNNARVVYSNGNSLKDVYQFMVGSRIQFN